MSEVKHKINTYEVDMICDVCSDGHMRSDCGIPVYLSSYHV